MSLALLLLFFILFMIGVPLPVSLGAAGVGVLCVYTDMPLDLLSNSMFSAMNSFMLVAVPLFIMVGIIMDRGGVAERIFDFANALFGWLPGGLGHVNVIASLIFGGVSGSSVADVASLGRIEINAMTRNNYSRRYSVGISLATSVLASIIPPSILMIIAGSTANESIGLLLVAGIAPGVFMCFCFMAYNHFYTKMKRMGTHVPFNWSNLYRATLRALPPMLTPLILLYGIFDGRFTPTEAAGIAVFYTLVLSIAFYRTIAVRELPAVFRDTAKTTGTILFIAATAKLAGWIFTYDSLPVKMAALMSSITDNPTVLLLIVFAFLIVVGMFMDAIASLYILIPVLLPPLAKLGVNPIHFLVILVLALTLGLITPPVGVCLYAAAQVAEMDIEEVIKGTFGLTVMIVVSIAILIVFPAIIIWPVTAVGLYSP
ncbi:MAG: TRAP transporter large permease [Planctomycetota bacterium]|jgi:tripartite ATP-independent transporter DctM subunit|nr:TRAP transporter large permease [Planctomycetota bacterium]